MPLLYWKQEEHRGVGRILSEGKGRKMKVFLEINWFPNSYFNWGDFEF
jgi:hypothetical protein